MAVTTHQSLRQADPNHKICIFGPQYCMPGPFQIMLREKFFKLREDCFKITDSNGQLFFQVKNPWGTLREKHILLDAYGNEICKIKKKLWAWRYTWHMNAGQNLEERRVTMAFRHFALHTKCYVYVYEPPYPHEDDDTNYDHLKPVIMMKSSVMGFDIKIYDGENQDQLYARMSKDVARELLVGTDGYCLSIEPDVDVAFMTSLALMWDYATTDMKNN
ncbi:hypothetical protein ACHWQZ_G018239 [Mnemiopsis leidyi]